MSFSLEPFRFPREHQSSPLDHDGMCIPDSPVHHQAAEATPAYEQEQPFPSPFDEEASELDPELSLPASEPFTTAQAREYLQNSLMTYRMTLEIPDSASTEVEDSPVEEQPSPQSSPQSVISIEEPAITEEDRTYAAIMDFITRETNPLTCWL